MRPFNDLNEATVMYGELSIYLYFFIANMIHVYTIYKMQEYVKI